MPARNAAPGQLQGFEREGFVQAVFVWLHIAASRDKAVGDDEQEVVLHAALDDHLDGLLDDGRIVGWASHLDVGHHLPVAVQHLGVARGGAVVIKEGKHAKALTACWGRCGCVCAQRDCVMRRTITKAIGVYLVCGAHALEWCSDGLEHELVGVGGPADIVEVASGKRRFTRPRIALMGSKGCPRVCLFL